MKAMSALSWISSLVEVEIRSLLVNHQIARCVSSRTLKEVPRAHGWKRREKRIERGVEIIGHPFLPLHFSRRGDPGPGGA